MNRNTAEEERVVESDTHNLVLFLHTVLRLCNNRTSNHRRHMARWAPAVAEEEQGVLWVPAEPLLEPEQNWLGSPQRKRPDHLPPGTVTYSWRLGFVYPQSAFAARQT
jgi:hypothetical protein